MIDQLARQAKDASAILADWAEDGGFDSIDVDEQRAVILEALDELVAEIERLRAAAADEPVPYFRSDYEARVKAGTNGPDLWPYPRSCT